MSPDEGRSGRSFTPPRRAYRTIWALHRAGSALSGSRLGLRSAGDDRRYAGTVGREIPIVILESIEREAHA